MVPTEPIGSPEWNDTRAAGAGSRVLLAMGLLPAVMSKAP
jgi:hypothetical protein